MPTATVHLLNVSSRFLPLLAATSGPVRETIKSRIKAIPKNARLLQEQQDAVVALPLLAPVGL